MKELICERARILGAFVVSSSTRCGKETIVSTGSEDSVVGMANPSSGQDISRPTGGTDPAGNAPELRTSKDIQLDDLSARAAETIPGHTLEKDLLTEALRQHYQSVLSEPLPDKLLQLLDAFPESDFEDPC